MGGQSLSSKISQKTLTAGTDKLLHAAAVEIKGKGVPFDMEPRPYTNPLGQEMKISFIYGPDDVWIEVVQPGS